MLSIAQVIKAEGQLVDLIQRISVLNKYERIISNGNSALARWLRGTINVFRFWIPTGKIIVYPDKGNEIKTSNSASNAVNNVGDEERIILNNNDSNAPAKNLVNIVVNNWLPTRFHRNATMDIKIMKAIKIVNEQKVARQKEEDREVYRRSTDQKILRNIINLKIQTNNLQHDLSSIKRHLNI